MTGKASRLTLIAKVIPSRDTEPVFVFSRLSTWRPIDK